MNVQLGAEQQRQRDEQARVHVHVEQEDLRGAGPSVAFDDGEHQQRQPRKQGHRRRAPLEALERLARETEAPEQPV